MKSILILCFALALSTTTHAQTTSYELTVTDAAHHLAEVAVTFPNVTEKALTVKLPVWRSGRYEILNLGKNLRDMSAKQNGHSLTVTQIDKNTWKVFLKSPGAVTFNYEVYANMLRHRVAHIDDSHAFIDASGFFMFSESFRQEPVTVNLDVPKKWRSVSGMDNLKGKNSFRAADYDVLVDSPIETGINQLHTFEVEGREYDLVVWGDGNYDVELMLTDPQVIQTAKEMNFSLESDDAKDIASRVVSVSITAKK